LSGASKGKLTASTETLPAAPHRRGRLTSAAPDGSPERQIAYLPFPLLVQAALG
jgi:hypothetical protein